MGETAESWEDSVPEKTPEKTTLSAKTPSFVPNASAAAFTPSWEMPAATAPVSSTPAASAPVASTPAVTTTVPVSKPAASPKAEKAAKTTKEAKPAAVIDPEDEVTEEMLISEVDSMKLVGKDYKEHLNIVFMGHVDAGKSTIGGHLLFLTGMVDQRTLDKYAKEAKEKNRESWYLSWALDTDAKEREKGKTVEVGRGAFETETKRYTILDAPGHKSYVPNMIGGAAQADVGVLVISARKGEFEAGFDRQGQTREHAMLAKTAGVRHLFIGINKMDDPTVEWSKDRFDEIVSKLQPFLKGVGFNPKTDLQWIPMSGFTGANLKDVVAPDVCPWYKGQSLVQALDTMKKLVRFDDLPLRVTVADKYKEMGTVMVGKVESGIVKLNQKLILMPNGLQVEVTAINIEEDEIGEAPSGSNVRIRLKGVEEEDLCAGFVLSMPNQVVHTATIFEAQLVILEHKSIICSGYSSVMHLHACVEEVVLQDLLNVVDKKTGKRSKKAPMFVKAGFVCIVRIKCEGLVCIENYSQFPQLGRFTLRDEGKTVAMGKVLKLIE